MMRFSFSILVMAFMLSMIACSSGDENVPAIPEKPTEEIPEIPEEPEKPEEPEEPDNILSVKFIVDIHNDFTDHTRAVNDMDGLYGVNVYQRSDEDKNGTDAQKKGEPYAYGFFDNLNSLILQLDKNRRYNFEMVYIPHGKDVIHQYEDGTYGNPFKPIHSDEVYAGNINEFIYTTTSKIDKMWQGVSQAKGISSSMAGENLFNDIDRYQGLLWNFDPLKSETINIKLYRMMFCIQLDVTNFTEGTITIKTTDGIKHTISGHSSGNVSTQKILEIPYMPSIDQASSEDIDLEGDKLKNYFHGYYYKSTRLILTYHKGDKESTIIDKEVSLQRIRIYPYNIEMQSSV